MEMAWKKRLEFAGAIYHVLSRGNYRHELFDHGSARLFEKTLLLGLCEVRLMDR